MAKFKYTGPSNVLVGRFGRLQTGQIVELWQSEAEYVLARGCDGWQPVKEKIDSEGIGTILPAKSRWFDLASIFWLKETVSSLKRMTRTDLLNVCRALSDLGAHVPAINELPHLSREALYETAYGEVKRLKWDQPGYGPLVNGKQPKAPVVIPRISSTAEEELREAQRLVTEQANQPAVEVQELASSEEAPPVEEAPKTVRQLRREAKPTVKPKK